MTIEGPRDSTEDNVRLRYRFLKQALQGQGIALNSNTKVLEVGSGNGLMLRLLRNDGVDAVGIDILPRGTNKIPQVAANIEQLPFADGGFDIIVSTQAFDAAVYDQNQEKMGAEIVRVLKVGGFYIGFSEMMEEVPHGLTLISERMNRKTMAVYKKTETA